MNQAPTRVSGSEKARIVGRIVHFWEQRQHVVDRKLRDSILPTQIGALLRRGYGEEFIVRVATEGSVRDLPYLMERCAAAFSDAELQAHYERKAQERRDAIGAIGRLNGQLEEAGLAVVAQQAASKVQMEKDISDAIYAHCALCGAPGTRSVPLADGAVRLCGTCKL